MDAAAVLWRSSPLLGIGAGNFLVLLPYTLPQKTIYYLQPVHNIYMLVLTELGVLGLLIMGLGLIRIIHRVLLAMRSSDGNPLGPLHLYSMALVSLGILGYIDHYPVTLQQGQLLLGLITGALWGICIHNSSKSSVSEG
jgi:O-antigen ligase